MSGARENDLTAADWSTDAARAPQGLSPLEYQRHSLAQARRAAAVEPHDRHRRGRFAGLRRIDIDAWFGFALFLDMLFLPQIKTAGAAFVIAAVLAYVALRRKRVLIVIGPRAFLFIAPALALASALWSEDAPASLQQGLEYAITVLAGVLLSATPRPINLLKALFLAFMTYLLISLALGGKVAVGITGGEAFSGLNGGKNMIADIAATAALISMGVGLGPNRRHRLIWAAVCLLAFGLDIYIVIAAKSAGAVLGLLAGVATLIVLAGLTAVGRRARGAVMVVLAIAAVGGIVAYQWVSSGLVGAGAGLFGKDTTLTGRTYLWYRAHDLIAAKPVLGMGYGAFWRQGNIDAEGLWRYAGITERGGFTFHNTLIEVLVQLGLVGAVTIVAVALVGVALMLKRMLQRPSLAFCCFGGLLAYNFARMPIESVGLSPFYFSTALMFVTLGAALTREQPRDGSGAERLALDEAGQPTA